MNNSNNRSKSNNKKDGTSNYKKEHSFGNKKDGTVNNKKDNSFNNKKEGSINNKKDNAFNNKKEGSINNKKDNAFNNKKEGSFNNKKDNALSNKKEGSFNKNPKASNNYKTNASYGKHADKFEPLESIDLPDTNSDILEGRNPVLEALRSGRTINKLLVAKGDREGSIRQITAIAKENGITVQEVDRRNLDSVSATSSHQGVIAYVSVKDYVEVDDILEASREKGEPPFIIILDEINDAHNLGSVLRTADAVGAHGVIIPKRRAVGLTSVVAKASAGAVEYVPVARVTNLAQTIDYLKKNNIWVIGTDQTGEKDFYKSDLKGPIALVIGSEGEGMGRLVREKCDFTVKIPMLGKISSLNASVAAAVVMYEIFKQRGQ